VKLSPGTVGARRGAGRRRGWHRRRDDACHARRGRGRGPRQTPTL